MTRGNLLRAGALLTAGAGVVHLVHASGQTEVRLAAFFLGAGIAQVGIAAFVARGRRWAPPAALALDAGLVALYAAVHLNAADPFTGTGVAAKALEVGALVLLAAGVARLEPERPTAAGAPPGRVTRRQLLRAGSVGAAGAVAGGVLSRVAAAQDHHAVRAAARVAQDPHGHFGNAAVGEVDTRTFDPMAYLREFDEGKVSRLADGRTLREFTVTAVDVEIEVAPGVYFPAWSYNGKVPGPTLRATEGDLVRVHFTNAGGHPHTMHFHGFHRAEMDGVFEIVDRGKTFTYEFEAEPFGLHLYHCHTVPLKRHIHKGLYGVFIVDPPGGRPAADEMVMMMNAFDTNFDGENEIYSVNTVAHYYLRHPIRIKANELVRIYLVNITEFDLINSFHSHATFFNEYRTGTRLEPDSFTDTIILGQGERSILELRYRFPGRYMFHAHVSEFAELGWSGMFEVAT